MSRVAHPAGPRHGDVLPADHPPAAPEDVNDLPEQVWPRGAHRSGGVLTLGGVDVRDLAADFGTPLYVCDEQDVRSRCREYLEAFSPEGRVFYAAKAFCSRAVLRWVSEEGLGVDVCTGGELEVALSAGVPPEQITMHGNNKMLDELSRAVSAGVGHIVVDSFEEIARLAYLIENSPARPNILVRVTTGVEAHTHEFMATAHDDQKFGFSLASGAADEAVRRVVACPGLSFAGLHSHIGSQIFDTAGFEVAAHRVVGLAVRIRNEHGIEIAELDLGGGFGIAYTDEDDAPEVKMLAQSLRDIVDAQCRAAGLARPRLTVEPGRGIVGPSTVSLYTVGTIKDVDGLRTYVSVDGGMSDNIRTALYDASYLCALASRASAAAPMLSRVVGRHCESGDIVVRHAWLELAGIAVRRVAHKRSAAIDRSLLTTDPHALATRPDVDIVVEVIGGIEPARSLLLAALKGGKPVVTANKALLAENGAEIYGAAREYGAPGARHRQRHHQLHPGPDGLLRRGLRRVAGGGAGARLRRGRSDRRRGGVRRGREGGHPGQPGLPHPGHRGRRAPRGHHRGERDRHLVRSRARPGGEAAGHLRPQRRRRLGPGAPGDDPAQPPAGLGRRGLQRGVRGGRIGRPAHVLRRRRGRHPDLERGARRHRRRGQEPAGRHAR